MQPAAPPTQMSESLAASARKTTLFATGIVCQVLPESNERCRAPAAESVQRIATLPRPGSLGIVARSGLSDLGGECVRSAASHCHRARRGGCGLNFLPRFLAYGFVFRLPFCGLRRLELPRGCPLHRNCFRHRVRRVAHGIVPGLGHWRGRQVFPVGNGAGAAAASAGGRGLSVDLTAAALSCRLLVSSVLFILLQPPWRERSRSWCDHPCNRALLALLGQLPATTKSRSDWIREGGGIFAATCSSGLRTLLSVKTVSAAEGAFSATGDSATCRRPIVKRDRRADHHHASRQRSPAKYRPAQPMRFLHPAPAPAWRAVSGMRERHDVPAIGALRQVLQHLGALAVVQRFLGERSQQVGIRMDSGLRQSPANAAARFLEAAPFFFRP